MSKNDVSGSASLSMDPRRKSIVFFGILIVMFSNCITYSINAITPQILSELNGMQYFALTAVIQGVGWAVMTPIGGALMNKIGRRMVLMIGTAMSLVCCIGLAITATPVMFLIFRTLIPFGQGFYQAVANTLTAEMYDESVIGKKYGALTVSHSLALILGSLISGVLYDAGMRELSLVWGGIVAIAGGIIVFVFMPKEQLKFKDNKLDVKGISLLVIFMCSFTYAMNFNGFVGGYSNPTVIAALIIMAVSLVGFFVVERKAEKPLIPFRLFKNRYYIGAFILMFAGNGYLITYQTYSYLQGSAILGESATVVALINTVRAIVATVLSYAIGAWVGKKFKDRAWIAGILCNATIAISFLALGFSTLETSIYVIISLVAFTGVSEAFRGCSLIPMAQLQMTEEEVAPATMFIGLGTSIWATIFPTVMSMVFGAIYNVSKLIPAELSAALNPDQLAMLQNTDTLSNFSILDPIKATLSSDLSAMLDQTMLSMREALSSAINVTYFMTAAVSVLLTIVAIICFKPKKKHMHRS